MEYRKLDAEVGVSCLALGGGVFGRDCGQEETVAVIRAAADLGINFIDTADVYSGGLSEEWIGAAVRGSRQRWIIATKAGVAGGETRAGSGRREAILKRAEESLRRLQTDYIDLYQTHHFDPETPQEETLEALDLLIRQGKARRVGASNYSGYQLRDALHISRRMGLASFSTTQAQYNLFKRACEKDLLPVCAEEGVRALAYGVLGRGVLTGKYDAKADPPADSRASSSRAIRADLAPRLLQPVEKVAALARGSNRSAGELALAWSLRRREVAAVIVGARSGNQLQANAAAIDWKLSEAELKTIDGIVGDPDLYRSFFSYGA